MTEAAAAAFQNVMDKYPHPPHANPEHRVIAIQFAHADLPIKTATKMPAVRLVGAFPTYRRGLKRLKNIAEAVPKIGTVCFWLNSHFTLIPKTVPKDEVEGEERLAALMAAHEERYENGLKAFHERVSKSKTEAEAEAEADAAGALESKETESTSATEPATVSETESAAVKHGTGFAKTPESADDPDEDLLDEVPRDQSVAVVSFIESYAEDGMRDPFGDAAVAVWGLFESADLAHSYIEANHSRMRSDVDLIVVKTGVWLFPHNYFTNEDVLFDRRFRDSRLNSIMSKKQMEHAAALRRHMSSFTGDGTIGDAVSGISTDFLNFREVDAPEPADACALANYAAEAATVAFDVCDDE